MRWIIISTYPDVLAGWFQVEVSAGVRGGHNYMLGHQIALGDLMNDFGAFVRKRLTMAAYRVKVVGET
jgi:hypothetical protein